MIASHEKRAAIYLDDCFDTTAHSPTLAKESLGMNKGTLEARGIRRTVVCLGTFENFAAALLSTSPCRFKPPSCRLSAVASRLLSAEGWSIEAQRTHAGAIGKTWTPEVCRIIAFCRFWAISLPTFGGLGNSFTKTATERGSGHTSRRPVIPATRAQCVARSSIVITVIE